MNAQIKEIVKAKAAAQLQAKNNVLNTRGTGLSLRDLSSRQLEEAIKAATVSLRRSYSVGTRTSQVDLGADLVSEALVKLYENPEKWDSSESSLHTYLVKIAKTELKKNLGRRFKREGVSYSYGLNDSDGEEQEMNVGNGEMTAAERIALEETLVRYRDLLTPRERVYIRLHLEAVSVAERNELEKNGLLDASYYTTGEIGQIMGFVTDGAYRKWKMKFEARNAQNFKK